MELLLGIFTAFGLSASAGLNAYIPLLVLQQCAECGIVLLNPRLTRASMLVVEEASTVYDLAPDAAEEWITGTLIPRARYLASFGRSQGRRVECRFTRQPDAAFQLLLQPRRGRRLGCLPKDGFKIAVVHGNRGVEV